MASLGKKDDVYHVRFRFRGRAYKRSLGTSDTKQADYLLCGVKQRLHELTERGESVANGMEICDFVMNNGRLSPPALPQVARPSAHPIQENAGPTTNVPVDAPSYGALRDRYLVSQAHLMADTYLSSQRTHLGHLEKFLGERSSRPCQEISGEDLDTYLAKRLDERHRNTVIRERNTFMQFFKWSKLKKYLQVSPAEGIQRILAGADLPKFSTKAEIEELIARGGMDQDAENRAWERLYLDYAEIAALLNLVRQTARHQVGYLLHAIPAYTGIRRGELMRLTWEDVDLQKGILTAWSRKQSRSKEITPRTIELNSELAEELRSWKKKQAKGQHVLCEPVTLQPLTGNRANRLFWQPLRKTEWCLSGRKSLFKIGFHTYRHSFASNLASSGIDARIIDALMGHKTEAMRKRYLHLFPSNRRAAIESFSLKVADASQSGAA